MSWRGNSNLQLFPSWSAPQDRACFEIMAQVPYRATFKGLTNRYPSGEDSDAAALKNGRVWGNHDGI